MLFLFFISPPVTDQFQRRCMNVLILCLQLQPETAICICTYTHVLMFGIFFSFFSVSLLVISEEVMASPHTLRSGYDPTNAGVLLKNHIAVFPPSAPRDFRTRRRVGFIQLLSCCVLCRYTAHRMRPSEEKNKNKTNVD